MKILHVVGARPNFMKAGPVFEALATKNEFEQVLVHTGQHYDDNMSKVFFDELRLPEPDFNLDVGSGSHAVQTAQIMMRMEDALVEIRPHLVVVYGDVNSTVAAALVCTKLLIPVAHVEAGLRSFDRKMPEEINRVLTDQMADLLFTPSKECNKNLLREGVAKERIHLVGNVMIDTLIRLLPESRVEASHSDRALVASGGPYALVTLHRPSNVDDLGVLAKILTALEDVSSDLSVIFPMHPRTRIRLREHRIQIPENARIHVISPVGYVEFLALQRDATVVITDSGGMQEETTFLGVPCLTVRENTERPVTVEVGTNTIVGQDMDFLKEKVGQILKGEAKKGSIPPLWDGKAGRRIADTLSTWTAAR